MWQEASHKPPSCIMKGRTAIGFVVSFFLAGAAAADADPEQQLGQQPIQPAPARGPAR